MNGFTGQLPAKTTRVDSKLLPRNSASLQGGEFGRSDEIVSHRAIEAAVAQIHEAAAVHLERAQVIVDGATLAGEQVQDTRLTLLERDPEVTTHAIILDLFVSLALESTVAGKILGAATRTILKPLLGTRAAFETLPKSAYGLDLLEVNRPSPAWRKETREAASRMVKAILRQDVDSGTFAVYHKTLAAVARGSPETEQNLNALIKVTSEASAQYVKKGLPFSAQDSPGVSIRSAAMAFASTNRLDVARRHARFEALARSGALSVNQLASLTDAFAWDDMPEHLSILRERYKLLYEATMWAKISGFDRVGGHLSYSGTGELKGVDPRLLRYWRQRFADAAREARRAKEPVDMSIAKWFVTLTRTGAEYQQGLLVKYPQLPKP